MNERSTKRSSIAPRIALIYLVASGLGLLISDQIVNATIADYQMRAVADLFLGLVFIAFTTGLLYVLIRRYTMALQQGEGQLRALFAAMTDVILVIDREGRYRQIAPTNPALLYRPPAELIGKTLHEIFPREQATTFLDGIQRALKTNRTVNLEYVLNIADRDVWFACSISPMTDTLVVWVARDVTKRKQAEAALARERDLLRALMDSIPDTIYFKDMAARFTLINQAQARVLGVDSPELAIGHTDAEYFPANIAQRAYEEELRIFATARPVINLEEFNPRPDGTPRWFSVTKVPLFDQAGQVVGLVGMSRDITSNKLAEEAIEQSRQKYESLMHSIDGIVWEAEPLTTRFTFVSQQAERLLGYPIERWTDEATFWKDHIHPDDRERAVDFCNDATRQLRDHEFEYRMIAADGHIVWLRDLVSVVAENDQPIALRGIMVDITAAKQRERELETVAAVASSLRTASTRVEMLPIILDQLTGLLPIDGAAIGLLDPITGEMIIEAARGGWSETVGVRVQLEQGLNSEVIRTGQRYSRDGVPGDPHAHLPEPLRDLRAVAVMPLIAQSQTIGVLAVGRQTDIADEEVRLLKAIGDIAASALHRAVTHEQAQRRTEQLATVNALGRALTELLDLPQVCEQLSTAIDQILPDVTTTLISLFDPAQQLITCIYGISDDELIDVTQLPPLPLEPLGFGPQSEAIHSSQPVIVDDLEERLKHTKTAMNFGEEPLPQSALYAPMLAEGEVIGVVQTQSYQLHRFTHEDAELLTFIANTAAVAIQNARLFEAEREQRALAEALRDTAASLSGTLNFDEVLDRMLINIGRVVPHDAANIMLIDETQGTARIARCAGYERIASGLEALVRGMNLPVTEVVTLQQMIETGQPCIIADTSTHAGWLNQPATRWVRSYIGAPIWLRDKVVGFLNVDSATPNFYTVAHAARLQTFADQAAIAVENARLFEAEREQRELSTALRDTAAALNSTLNIDEVLDRILSNVGRIVPNDTAGIMQFEGGTARLVRVFGYTDQVRIAALRDVRLNVAEAANLRFMIETGRPLAIADVKAYPGWIDVPESDWIRSHVETPIRVKGQIIGALSLDSDTPNFYTSLHAERLQVFAAQAAVAIENAQLFNETQQRVKELATLYESSLAITATLDRSTVLHNIAQRLAEVVDATSAYVLSCDLESRTATVIAEYFGPAAHALERISDLGLTLELEDHPATLAALRAGQPLMALISQPDIDPGAVEQLRQYGGKSSLRVPFMVASQMRGYAVLWDSRVERIWTDTEIRLCQTLANQAAVAMENVHLFEEVQKRLTEQSALLAASTAISSSLDLPIVLQRLAEQMGRAIDATSVYICNWNLRLDTTSVLAEYYGPAALPQERVSDLGVMYHMRRDFGVDSEWLRAARTFAWHIDAPTMPEQTRRHIQQFGGQSVLSIPLIAKDTVFGYAELWESRRRREFTRDEISLCQSIAQQAAIAFDNARLFEAERKQLRLAQTLQDVGALLTAEMSLDEVFDYLFDLLAHVVNYDSVSVQLLDGQRMYLAAGRGFPDIGVVNTIIRSIAAQTLEERWGPQHRRVVVIPDTHTDPRWIAAAGSEYIRSWIGAALRVKGRLFGILNVDSKTPNAYDDELGETVAAFANQAAIAMENAQLHDAVRRHADELEARVDERTAELDHERRRLAAILDTAGEGVVFTDANGAIEYINPAMQQLTGYSAAEALGQNPRIWQSGTTSPALYHRLWDRIKRGTIWQGEMVNRRKDGSLYDASMTIAPLSDADGKIVGFVGVQRDITHQKELDRLKDEFVSNVSHELRTPIANVKLYINLLTRGKPEKREEYMQTLRRETARLEKLIEDLLDLSRLDLGTTKAALVSTDLNQLLAQLVADRSALAAERGLAIDFQTEAAVVTAWVDPALLVQVISNLLTNAINYTPPGGLITVTIAPRQRDGQDWATFTVKDTGPGIAPTDLPHLFERFYRGEVGRKSGAPGTGLGLAISTKIVDRLGGHITIESQPGQGAAFTVWLKPADHAA